MRGKKETHGLQMILDGRLWEGSLAYWQDKEMQVSTPA